MIELSSFLGTKPLLRVRTKTENYP